MQLEPFEKKKPVSSYFEKGEPVWPSGKALGWLAAGPRFESASALFLFKSCGLCGHCLVCDFVPHN